MRTVPHETLLASAIRSAHTKVKPKVTCRHLQMKTFMWYIPHSIKDHSIGEYISLRESQFVSLEHRPSLVCLDS